MPTGTYTSPETNLAILNDIARDADTIETIATRRGVSCSVVTRLSKKYVHRGTRSLEELAAPQRRGIGTGAVLKPRKTTADYYHRGSKHEKFRKRINRLRERGLTILEVANKLKLSRSAIAMVLYGSYHKKKETTALATIPVNQNRGSAHEINKYVYVGIYVAESERLGRVISERFGVNADWLRSGLSEFLDSEKIRRTPRPSD